MRGQQRINWRLVLRERKHPSVTVTATWINVHQRPRIYLYVERVRVPNRHRVGQADKVRGGQRGAYGILLDRNDRSVLRQGCTVEADTGAQVPNLVGALVTLCPPT